MGRCLGHFHSITQSNFYIFTLSHSDFHNFTLSHSHNLTGAKDAPPHDHLAPALRGGEGAARCAGAPALHNLPCLNPSGEPGLVFPEH